jgi:hypothetical protein
MYVLMSIKSDDTKEDFYEELYKFPEHHMNIVLGNFNVKLGKEDILSDNWE